MPCSEALLIYNSVLYLSAAAAPGSPADRWEHFAPHRRSSRPRGEGREAEDPGPPPAELLFHRSWPARRPCFLPLPPRGRSAPAETEAARASERVGTREQQPCGACPTHRRDVRLIWSTVVVGHQGVELQRVELETGVVDVLHILHGVFVHGEQRGSLEDTISAVSLFQNQPFFNSS